MVVPIARRILADAKEEVHRVTASCKFVLEVLLQRNVLLLLLSSRISRSKKTRTERQSRAGRDWVACNRNSKAPCGFGAELLLLSACEKLQAYIRVRVGCVRGKLKHKTHYLTMKRRGSSYHSDTRGLDSFVFLCLIKLAAYYGPTIMSLSIRRVFTVTLSTTLEHLYHFRERELRQTPLYGQASYLGSFMRCLIQTSLVAHWTKC